MTSEYQEDGKTLKENYEKMSKKTSNGDGLVDVEEQDRGVRMCWTQPHQDPTCLPQCQCRSLPWRKQLHVIGELYT